jgi:hypothetical protein
MSNFKCSICCREFKSMVYLQKHYNKKTICKKPSNLHKSSKKGRNKAKKRPKKGQNKAEIRPKKGHLKLSEIQTETKIQDDNKTENKDEDEDENNKPFSCQYCNKKYELKDSLYKHINQLRCSKIPEDAKNLIIYKRKNKILQKKVKEQNAMIQIKNSNINSHNTITNSHNTNNTNNITIKINPFGQENTDFLTKKEKLKIINKCYMSVPALIKTIHNRPENRNLYIRNINSKIMACLNNENELVYDDYNALCDELVQSNITRIDEYFEELNSDMKESTKSRLVKMVEESNSGVLTDKYIDDIKYYLLNISRRNKKDLNDFIDKIEEEIQNNRFV